MEDLTEWELRQIDIFGIKQAKLTREQKEHLDYLKSITEKVENE